MLCTQRRGTYDKLNHLMPVVVAIIIPDTEWSTGKDGHIYAEVKLAQRGYMQRLTCNSYSQYTHKGSLTHTNSHGQDAHKDSHATCTASIHTKALSLTHTNSHGQDAHKDSHTHKQIVLTVYTQRQTHTHTHKLTWPGCTQRHTHDSKQPVHTQRQKNTCIRIVMWNSTARVHTETAAQREEKPWSH